MVTFDVGDCVCERYVRQLPDLAGRPGLITSHKGKGQRSVVREDGEGPAGEQVAEVSHGQVDTQELAVEGQIVPFSQVQVPGPKFEQPPAVISHLLKDGTGANVDGIGGEPDGIRVDGEGKGCGFLKGGFCKGEGSLAFRRPGEWDLWGCHVGEWLH